MNFIRDDDLWFIDENTGLWCAHASFEHEETDHFIALLQSLRIIGAGVDEYGQGYVTIKAKQCQS